MYKSCSKCGKIHNANYVCGKRLYTRTDRDKFRQSSAWTKKSLEIKQRDNFLCVVCKDKGLLTYDYLETHHIEKLNERYDLRLDNNNLITLCIHHHKKADRGELDKEYLKGLIIK